MEWLTPPAALPAPSLQRAYLSLSVNGMDQGQILALVGDGEVWVAVDDLVRAGLRELDVPTQTIDGRSYVSSRHLTPGIEFTFDDRNLAVQLTAPTRYFGTTTVKLGGSTPRGMVYGKNTSAFFNYALDWQNLKQFSEFSELGLSSRGNLYYTGFSVAPGGKFIRGLSNATFDNPARMTRWVLGDTFASGGTLGGGTFLGGITFSRDFSLNPYFVRYPGVQLSGQTLTPSSADIYVNGHLVGTRALPPGKFDITGLPLVAGGGTTQVIVRDAFGHTQTLSSSYYFATSVLQRGLSEYSYSLGAQRNDVGTASSNYGPLVFVGFDRVGVTDWFTAGMRVDGGPGLVSGGPTAAFRLGRGQLGINASASHAAGIGGAAAEADYTYQNRSLSYGGSLALTSPHYATLSLASAADRETSLASAFAGFELGPRASLTVNYATSRWRDSGSRQDLS
ncbi:MAG TPA: fimbria/pilus outer membrane usher protein, partial [Candidatus Eremiobacteraceae bacterium]|nr:fimbria/pilus outer membrane usher protein [Candidatus Eremiobacteraceae bacterium]